MPSINMWGVVAVVVVYGLTLVINMWGAATILMYRKEYHTFLSVWEVKCQNYLPLLEIEGFPK